MDGDKGITYTYPAEVIRAKVAERTALQKRVKELEAALNEIRDEHKRLKDCEESLNHLLHLHHGISIGGPEFSPPSTSEWNAALSRARSVLDDE